MIKEFEDRLRHFAGLFKQLISIDPQYDMMFSEPEPLVIPGTMLYTSRSFLDHPLQPLMDSLHVTEASRNQAMVEWDDIALALTTHRDSDYIRETAASVFPDWKFHTDPDSTAVEYLVLCKVAKLGSFDFNEPKSLKLPTQYTLTWGPRSHQYVGVKGRLIHMHRAHEHQDRFGVYTQNYCPYKVHTRPLYPLVFPTQPRFTTRISGRLATVRAALVDLMGDEYREIDLILAAATEAKSEDTITSMYEIRPSFQARKIKPHPRLPVTREAIEIMKMQLMLREVM